VNLSSRLDHYEQTGAESQECFVRRLRTAYSRRFALLTRVYVDLFLAATVLLAARLRPVIVLGSISDVDLRSTWEAAVGIIAGARKSALSSALDDIYRRYASMLGDEPREHLAGGHTVDDDDVPLGLVDQSDKTIDCDVNDLSWLESISVVML
jgi:hypothetical protein